MKHLVMALCVVTTILVIPVALVQDIWDQVRGE